MYIVVTRPSVAECGRTESTSKEQVEQQQVGSEAVGKQQQRAKRGDQTGSILVPSPEGENRFTFTHEHTIQISLLALALGRTLAPEAATRPTNRKTEVRAPVTT